MLLKGKHILIIDDILKNLEVTGKILKDEGYQISLATDGKQALSQLEQSIPDLILLDVMMPEINGYELCKIIKKRKTLSEIPVIFLTAKIETEDLAEGFEAGGVDYITKPFNNEELKIRVKNHLELKLSREKLESVNQILEEKVNERTLELKDSNNKLAKANEELMNLDRVKVEFLKIISHEIRTPLNGLVGPIQLLKNKLKDNKLSNLIEILDTSVCRLEKFSMTALSITELQTGSKKISLNEIRMKEFIEDFINVKIKMLEPKNLQFQIAPIPDELKIFWDPKLLKTCFDSIIENAVKFSPENGNIFIRYYEEDSRITFEICDEGTGFSEHAFQRLFTMFMPGEPHVDQNTGLQLTLVKLIMDAQSGKLEVTNRKEGGACIKLIF